MLRQWISAFALALAGFLAFDPQPARAQTPSLGGYGASSSMTQAGMGGSGPIIPYGGGLSGFMPYRMGGAGTGLSFSSRNSSTVGTGRSAFRLSSMTGGMGMSSSAFGQSLGRGTAGSLFSPGLGGGMGRSMDCQRRPERHAAQLRISILPAAEPAPAFVDWRGNVVNVTAHGLSDRAK